MWKGASPTIFSNAKHLRENMTNAELILWNKLKGKQFFGLKFRRQHPIHRFIADFYCHKLKLIIEIDGEYHQRQDQKEYDIERDEILRFNDIKVLRFTNNEVEDHLDDVLLKLEKNINLLPRP